MHNRDKLPPSHELDVCFKSSPPAEDVELVPVRAPEKSARCLMSSQEVCKLLGITQPDLDRIAAQNLLAPVGKVYGLDDYYSPSDVAAYLTR